MARRALWMILAASALAAAADNGSAVREIGWEDLLPAGQHHVPPVVVDHSGIPPANDFPPPASAAANVVDELDGKIVKLPGFIVPLDYVEGKVASALLVPYFGACIHMPPPPPNQIVHVKFDEPIDVDSIWDPVWITGKLGLERYASQIAEAGYSMRGQEVEEYRY